VAKSTGLSKTLEKLSKHTNVSFATLIALLSDKEKCKFPTDTITPRRSKNES
jgi:hypothetical protein